MNFKQYRNVLFILIFIRFLNVFPTRLTMTKKNILFFLIVKINANNQFVIIAFELFNKIINLRIFLE